MGALRVANMFPALFPEWGSTHEALYGIERSIEAYISDPNSRFPDDNRKRGKAPPTVFRTKHTGVLRIMDAMGQPIYDFGQDGHSFPIRLALEKDIICPAAPPKKTKTEEKRKEEKREDDKSGAQPMDVDMEESKPSGSGEAQGEPSVPGRPERRDSAKRQSEETPAEEGDAGREERAKRARVIDGIDAFLEYKPCLICHSEDHGSLNCENLNQCGVPRLLDIFSEIADNMDYKRKKPSGSSGEGAPSSSRGKKGEDQSAETLPGHPEGESVDQYESSARKGEAHQRPSRRSRRS